ncbi:MAG: GNAT family N-acetyltransferase [Candidatus Thorarchaeota archaeon]
MSVENLTIIEATDKHSEIWAEIFIEGIKGFRGMMRYLSRLRITKTDVAMSFLEDIKIKKKEEQFLIALLNEKPVGIIRFDQYFIPDAVKILSHFPLVHPRYQRKGIGKALVKEGVVRALKQGFQEIWSECWALNQREIQIYEGFYNAIGFNSKSSRYEMCCFLEDTEELEIPEIANLTIKTSNTLNNDIVLAISKAYAQSEDILHSLEKLDDEENTKGFLTLTYNTFLSLGFIVNFTTAYIDGVLCGGLMTATTNEKGMILEVGILPEFRGKKIAKMMISNYINDLAKKDVKEIILGVDKNNKQAIQLYEKLNFKITWFGKVMLLEDKEKLGI